MLIRISAALFGVSVVSLLLNALSSYRYVQVSAEALFDMRLAVFRHLQKLSPRFYARTAMGDILSRLNNDVSEIQRVATDTLLSIVTNVILLVGTVALLLLLQPWLFLLSIALLPPSIWILRHYRTRVSEKNRGLREASAAMGSFLVEAHGTLFEPPSDSRPARARVLPARPQARSGGATRRDGSGARARRHYLQLRRLELRPRGARCSTASAFTCRQGPSMPSSVRAAWENPRSPTCSCAELILTPTPTSRHRRRARAIG